MSKHDFYTAVRTAQTIIAEGFATTSRTHYLHDAEKLLYTDHKVLFTWCQGLEFGNENTVKLEKQFSTFRIPSTSAFPTGQPGAKMFAKVTSVAGDVITMPTAIGGKLVNVQWVVIASASKITDRPFSASSGIMMTQQVFAAICVDGWVDEDIAELVAVITGTDSAEAEQVEEQVEVVAELTDGIRCGECGADVSDTEDGWCACLDVATTDGHSIRRAVAATVEEMKGMTDAEVHMWAGKWAELALKASWDQMSQAMATVFGDENQRRIASK